MIKPEQIYQSLFKLILFIYGSSVNHTFIDLDTVNGFSRRIKIDVNILLFIIMLTRVS